MKNKHKKNLPSEKSSAYSRPHRDCLNHKLFGIGGSNHSPIFRSIGCPFKCKSSGESRISLMCLHNTDLKPERVLEF